MQLAEFLDRLGYAESPTFLRPQQDAFRIDPDFGHIFRRASETLALQGVYTLRPDVAGHSPSVPIVYVCEADDETKADDFHRLIWNQDVVPFVLIYTPLGVKLYSGFRHQRRHNGPPVGILQPLTEFNQLDQLVHDFSADAINSGRLWQRRAGDVAGLGPADAEGGGHRRPGRAYGVALAAHPQTSRVRHRVLPDGR